MNPDWYSRSLKRMERAAFLIAGVAFLVILVNAGWRNAIGFAAGATIAHFNFGAWKRITSAVGEQGGEAPGDSKAFMLGLRYLLMGAAVFVIIKVLDASVLAVMGGLLVTVAAVLVELIRQLVRPGDSSHEI